MANRVKAVGLDIAGSFLKLGGVVTAVAGTFVTALNPNLMQSVGLGVRDLAATLGVAFQPLFQTILGLTRQIAGVLLPLMQQLSAPIRELSNAIGTALLVYIRLLVARFQLWVPLLSAITPLLEALASWIAQLQAPLLAIADVLSSFLSIFTGGVQSALTNFVTEMQKCVSTLIIFTAAVAKSFGFDRFVERLIKRYEEAVKPPEGGTVASGQTGISSLAEITRQIAISAAKAQSGPTKEEQQEAERKAREEEMKALAQQTVDALKEIQKAKNTEKLLEFLQTNFPLLTAPLGALLAVQEGLNRIADHIVELMEAYSNYERERGKSQTLDERLAEHHRTHGLPPPRKAGESGAFGRGSVLRQGIF